MLLAVNTALEWNGMNTLIEHTHDLFAAHAQSQARIRGLMGRNRLALVTPELSQELKRVDQITQLIDLALNELMGAHSND